MPPARLPSLCRQRWRFYQTAKHFGSIFTRTALTYADLFSEPVELRFGAVLSAGILQSWRSGVRTGGLQFETLRLDVADSGLPADLAQGVEDETQIVATLLDDAVSGVFPTPLIPAFTLPESVSDLGLPQDYPLAS